MLLAHASHPNAQKKSSEDLDNELVARLVRIATVERKKASFAPQS
jgi:hypothetical protein